MRVFGIKSCDTCRKAIKALEAVGRSPELVDIRANPLSRAEFERFHVAFGDALLNRASTTWRSLSEGERTGDPLDLLVAHPTLMKRPVIDTGDALYLGWKDDVRSALLGE